MDIEGAEVEALRGAHATIREGRPAMLVEVHKDVGPSFAEYFEKELAPLGYRASFKRGPTPVSTKRHKVVLLSDGGLAPSA
jgi:hypothetical protein